MASRPPLVERGELQKGFEGGEDGVPDEIPNGREEWDDELPRGHRRSLVEGYRAAELELHVHLRTRQRLGLKDYCAVFTRAEPRADEVRDLAFSDVEAPNLPDARDQGRESVLVEVVETVQDAQQTLISSVVRLESLKGCVHAGWHPLLWSDLCAHGSTELGGRRGDRELSHLLVRGWVGARHHDCEPVGEVVEGMTEVVDHVADQEPEGAVVGVVRLLEDAEANDVVAGLKVTLSDDQAGVAFRPPLLGRVKRVQVFERPVQLQAVA